MGQTSERQNSIVESYPSLTENEILKKLEKAREQANARKYRDANHVITDIRNKYGL